MRLSRRSAGAVVALGVVLAAAGCSSDASPSTAPSSSATPSVSASATSSATPSPSGTPVDFKDFPTATFNAKATGVVTGTMRYPGSKGCRIVKKSDPGVALTIGMGVTVPTRKTAVMFLAVSKPGRSELVSPAFMTVFGYGDVWNTQGPGGGGTATVSADGRKGTFKATLMPEQNTKGGPLELEGAFTCG